MATRIEMTASGPYLVWAGDGTKNDNNAIFYIKSNGDAFFGGSLRAGQLVTSASSGLKGRSGVTIETGEFGTNGNPKVITFSTYYSNFGRFDTPITSTNTVNIVLERSYNGGSWTQLASASGGGATTSTYDSELGYYLVQAQAGASGNYTDNHTGTGTFNYRTRVISGTGQWPVTLGAGPNWSDGSQSTVIRSVEQ